MGHRTALGADRPHGAERAHVRLRRDRGGLRPGARVGRVGGEARAEARRAGAVSGARAARVGGRAQRGLVGAHSAGWWARAARVGGRAQRGLAVLDSRTLICAAPRPPQATLPEPNANLRGPVTAERSLMRPIWRFRRIRERSGLVEAQ